MPDPRTETRRLPTGERVTLHECPWRGADRHWEAEVLIPELPGPADRHASGATADEAVRCLAKYVDGLRCKVNYDD